MLAAALVGSRFLHYAALLILLGASLFPAYSFARGRSEPAALLVWRQRLLHWSVALALLSGVAWLLFTAAGMSGDVREAANPETVWLALTETEFGHLWIARLAVAVLVIVLLAVRIRAAWPMVVASGALLSSLALTGHARSTEGVEGALHMGADTIHLLAAGVWIGALLPLGFMLRRLSAEVATVEALKGFSTVGYLAVGALVITGLINGLFLIESPVHLVDTGYGRLLLVKIALFVLMLSFAAANRVYLTPRLTDPTTAVALRRFKRNVWAEQGLAVLIVLAVSLLGTLDPAL